MLHTDVIVSFAAADVRGLQPTTLVISHEVELLPLVMPPLTSLRFTRLQTPTGLANPDFGKTFDFHPFVAIDSYNLYLRTCKQTFGDAWVKTSSYPALQFLDQALPNNALLHVNRVRIFPLDGFPDTTLKVGCLLRQEAV